MRSRLLWAVMRLTASGDWRPFRALTPAQPRKFLRERREPRPSLRIGFGDCHQYAEASNGLLRPRAVSDHATALLSVVMNFRRPMWIAM